MHGSARALAQPQATKQGAQLGADDFHWWLPGTPVHGVGEPAADKALESYQWARSH
jgi:hypothetical protein